MGACNQYYVGANDRKLLEDFSRFYDMYDCPYLQHGEETSADFEIYYEGKYYDLVDRLALFSKKNPEARFFVHCNGEMRDDYFYALVLDGMVYRKDIEVSYPSIEDCEELLVKGELK